MKLSTENAFWHLGLPDIKAAFKAEGGVGDRRREPMHYQVRGTDHSEGHFQDRGKVDVGAPK